MTYYTLLAIFLATSIYQNGQPLKSEIHGNKIYVKAADVIIDSIAVFSPTYSKHLIEGNSIYYTDGIVTPDRVNIRLFKKTIGENDKARSAPIKSIYHEREAFIGIKLSSQQITLRFRNENGRKKVTYSILSLFN